MDPHQLRGDADDVDRAARIPTRLGRLLPLAFHGTVRRPWTMRSASRPRRSRRLAPVAPAVTSVSVMPMTGDRRCDRGSSPRDGRRSRPCSNVATGVAGARPMDRRRRPVSNEALAHVSRRQVRRRVRAAATRSRSVRLRRPGRDRHGPSRVRRGAMARPSRPYQRVECPRRPPRRSSSMSTTRRSRPATRPPGRAWACRRRPGACAVAWRAHGHLEERIVEHAVHGATERDELTERRWSSNHHRKPP